MHDLAVELIHTVASPREGEIGDGQPDAKTCPFETNITDNPLELATWTAIFKLLEVGKPPKK